MRPQAHAHHDDEGIAGAPDAALLAVAIELADHAMRGLSLSRSAYARLLCDLYEGVRMRMPYRELLDFARATALRAQGDPASREADDAMPQVMGAAMRGRAAG